MTLCIFLSEKRGSATNTRGGVSEFNVDWILHRRHLYNYIANKHSTTVTSTFCSVGDARMPAFKYSFDIIVFMQTDPEGALTVLLFYFFLSSTYIWRDCSRRKKKISIGFLSSIVASESLVERYNTPWELLSLLNMLFLAHLCHRLSIICCRLLADFRLDRNRLLVPNAWCMLEDFRGLSYF